VAGVTAADVHVSTTGEGADAQVHFYFSGSAANLATAAAKDIPPDSQTAMGIADLSAPEEKGASPKEETSIAAYIVPGVIVIVVLIAGGVVMVRRRKGPQAAVSHTPQLTEPMVEMGRPPGPAGQRRPDYDLL